MSSLGYYLLLAAFVVGAYAAAISVAGARRRSRPMMESGIGAFYMVAAIMAAASAVIIYSFLTGDYSIRYVQRYSDSTLPLFYKITSYWGGLDGSIMFWVFLLSLFGSAAVYINRERHRELIPYVIAVISVVEMFFVPEKSEIGSWQPPQYRVDVGPFCLAIVSWMAWKALSIAA